MALLSCRNLTLGYDGHPLVSNLSFEVHAGEYLCIAGENGAGKSTLMRTMLGLQAPLAGEIVTGDGLRHGQIGYLPQQTVVQKDFPASVWEVVLSGCQGRRGWWPFYSYAERLRAHDNIHRMELEALSRRCYRELSGGQQQRVLLARALCATDRLLMLDEPVAGLDPHIAEQMYAQVERLNRQDGIAVVMVSHDVRTAMAYATHVLHIGPEVFYGTVAEYAESPQGRRFICPEA